jgi:hypothetical protein
VDDQLLAHSALRPDVVPQTYAAHIGSVVKGARTRVEGMVAYHRDTAVRAALANAVVDAASSIRKISRRSEKAVVLRSHGIISMPA